MDETQRETEVGSERGTGPDELPHEDGLRSDTGGTGAGVAPVAGRGGADEQAPPSGQFTSAGGGHGVGSGDNSSGGSGSGSEPETGGPTETDWLRSEETGAPRD